METNPYATTVQTSGYSFEPGAIGYTFKSTRVLSYWVIGLLAVVGFFSTIIGVVNIIANVMIPGFASAEVPLEGLGLVLVGIMALSALVLLPSLLACVITYYSPANRITRRIASQRSWSRSDSSRRCISDIGPGSGYARDHGCTRNHQDTRKPLDSSSAIDFVNERDRRS